MAQEALPAGWERFERSAAIARVTRSRLGRSIQKRYQMLAPQGGLSQFRLSWLIMPWRYGFTDLKNRAFARWGYRDEARIDGGKCTRRP